MSSVRYRGICAYYSVKHLGGEHVGGYLSYVVPASNCMSFCNGTMPRVEASKGDSGRAVLSDDGNCIEGLIAMRVNGTVLLTRGQLSVVGEPMGLHFVPSNVSKVCRDHTSVLPIQLCLPGMHVQSLTARGEYEMIRVGADCSKYKLTGNCKFVAGVRRVTFHNEQYEVCRVIEAERDVVLLHCPVSSRVCMSVDGKYHCDRARKKPLMFGRETTCPGKGGGTFEMQVPYVCPAGFKLNYQTAIIPGAFSIKSNEIPFEMTLSEFLEDGMIIATGEHMGKYVKLGTAEEGCNHLGYRTGKRIAIPAGHCVYLESGEHKLEELIWHHYWDCYRFRYECTDWVGGVDSVVVKGDVVGQDPIWVNGLTPLYVTSVKPAPMLYGELNHTKSTVVAQTSMEHTSICYQPRVHEQAVANATITERNGRLLVSPKCPIYVSETCSNTTVLCANECTFPLCPEFSICLGNQPCKTMKHLVDKCIGDDWYRFYCIFKYHFVVIMSVVLAIIVVVYMRHRILALIVVMLSLVKKVRAFDTSSPEFHTEFWTVIYLMIAVFFTLAFIKLLQVLIGKKTVTIHKGAPILAALIFLAAPVSLFPLLKYSLDGGRVTVDEATVSGVLTFVLGRVNEKILIKPEGKNVEVAPKILGLRVYDDVLTYNMDWKGWSSDLDYHGWAEMRCEPHVPSDHDCCTNCTKKSQYYPDLNTYNTLQPCFGVGRQRVVACVFPVRQGSETYVDSYYITPHQRSVKVEVEYGSKKKIMDVTYGAQQCFDDMCVKLSVPSDTFVPVTGSILVQGTKVYPPSPLLGSLLSKVAPKDYKVYPGDLRVPDDYMSFKHGECCDGGTYHSGLVVTRSTGFARWNANKRTPLTGFRIDGCQLHVVGTTSGGHRVEARNCAAGTMSYVAVVKKATFEVTGEKPTIILDSVEEKSRGTYGTFDGTEYLVSVRSDMDYSCPVKCVNHESRGNRTGRCSPEAIELKAGTNEFVVTFQTYTTSMRDYISVCDVGKDVVVLAKTPHNQILVAPRHDATTSADEVFMHDIQLIPSWVWLLIAVVVVVFALVVLYFIYKCYRRKPATFSFRKKYL